MMVISTLLNSCVVLPTNSPKGGQLLRLRKLPTQQFDLLFVGKCLLRLRQRHQRLPEAW